MTPAARGPGWRGVLFVACCLGSIATLLGHLYGVASMRTLTIVLWVPSTIAMLALWLRARRLGDTEFLLRARAGLIGGLWGTIGYDWCRVPLHVLGENPFPPIRSYGMWVLGAAHSTPLTDLTGLLYHFSNGLTFGLIYAMAAFRRHWAWALVWGVGLESLAVASPFGHIYAIRYAANALVIAYVAHLFYGAPLGWTCKRLSADSRAGTGKVSLALLTALFIGWFMQAWQPIGSAPAIARGEIVAEPRALHPGWTDAPVGSALTLRNTTTEAVTFRYRHSSEARTPGRTITIEPAQHATVPLDRPGLYQVMAPGTGWRSVFVAVRDGKSYR